MQKEMVYNKILSLTLLTLVLSFVSSSGQQLAPHLPQLLTFNIPQGPNVSPFWDTFQNSIPIRPNGNGFGNRPNHNHGSHHQNQEQHEGEHFGICVKPESRDFIFALSYECGWHDVPCKKRVRACTTSFKDLMERIQVLSGAANDTCKTITQECLLQLGVQLNAEVFSEEPEIHWLIPGSPSLHSTLMFLISQLDKEQKFNLTTCQLQKQGLLSDDGKLNCEGLKSAVNSVDMEDIEGTLSTLPSGIDSCCPATVDFSIFEFTVCLISYCKNNW